MVQANAAQSSNHHNIVSSARPIYATHALARDCPAGIDIADVASGVPAVRVSRLGQDLILWFRPETSQTVNWAGNPNDKIAKINKGSCHGVRLTPRALFNLFFEPGKDRALPWTDMETKTALRLRLLVMELVVSHAEHAGSAEFQALAQVKTLADLSYRKDEFLAMLSHELRNPLMAIFYALPLLVLQKTDDLMQLRARGMIERQAGRLHHLVDDLLEVSRITTGRVQFRLTQVSICGVMARAIETAQPLIAQRRHALTVSLPEQPLCLPGDAARLEQVVVNLLTNAVKYTEEDGRIALSVQQEGSSAVLRVQDPNLERAAGISRPRGAHDA